MKVLLPLHCDSDNRGCEAITKGTAYILNQNKEDVIAYSRNIALDKRMGLDNFVSLCPVKDNFSFLTRLLSKGLRMMYKDPYYSMLVKYKSQYKPFLDKANKGDIVLSTGGDLMCYHDNEVIFINDYCKRKGIKSILWGCSVGESNLTPRKIKTLKSFDLIYVRESLTKEVLQNIGINNLMLAPDPAFGLQPEKCDVKIIGEKVIGINLSNFVRKDFSMDSSYGKNLINLFDEIINHTDYNILLIPHVLWKGQNDEIICNLMYDRYKHTERVQVIDTHKYNYCEIRYIIGKCDLFIGARTHSVISAYSMKIPTLALGYSIKSKGIAKDLGLPNELVVDCVHLENDQELRNRFIYLDENQEIIKTILYNRIDDYKGELATVRDSLELIPNIII